MDKGTCDKSGPLDWRQVRYEAEQEAGIMLGSLCGIDHFEGGQGMVLFVGKVIQSA